MFISELLKDYERVIVKFVIKCVYLRIFMYKYVLEKVICYIWIEEGNLFEENDFDIVDIGIWLIGMLLRFLLRVVFLVVFFESNCVYKLCDFLFGFCLWNCESILDDW